jgi:tRNA modification GTPase
MEETIAAISTAYGEGGIGIVRISGEETEQILGRIFVPASHEKTEDRRLTYGSIIDPRSGEIIDEVLAVFMRAPHTYTKEDVAEIDCHGSVVSLRRILQLATDLGARIAEPGEFTKRAFLNGRIDLSQAEAVMDMISAKTDRTYDVAVGQLSGKLSGEIRKIRAALMDTLVQITVNIDYPDEDIEPVLYEKLKNETDAAAAMTDRLLSTADAGKIIREGLRTVIIGRPNVGKSSLMNALLREARAIVTEIPGTTRDTIEETISIKGIPVKLTDTAGIRDTGNVIEQKGIEKSKQSFNDADLIIFMIDASEGFTDEDREIAAHIGGRSCIVLANKKDLGCRVSQQEIISLVPGADVMPVSVRDAAEIEEIEEHIAELVYGGEVKQEDSLIVTDARHRQLLKAASSSLADAAEMTAQGEALEIIEVDISSAYASLGEIIGEAVSDDIINEVFSRFCLGK